MADKQKPISMIRPTVVLMQVTDCEVHMHPVTFHSGDHLTQGCIDSRADSFEGTCTQRHPRLPMLMWYGTQHYWSRAAKPSIREQA